MTDASKIQYIIIVALGIAVIVLVTLLKTERRKSANKDTIIAEKNDSISYWKSENGRNVAEKNAAIGTARQLAAAYPELKDELKDLRVQVKNLRAYIQNTIQASGSGEATVIHHHYTDSTGKKYPYWELKAQDGYLNFKASIVDSLHAPYTYTYTDTVTTAISVKKKWLGFGKDQLYATTSLRNPNAKVISATNLLVDTFKDKRWIVYVGVGYDPINNTVTPNIGVGYSLLKF
jgi:hypothetical protein